MSIGRARVDREGKTEIRTAEPGTWASIRETVKVGVQALLIALVVRTLLFQPFNIPSGSLIPTLLIGDYLFVSKYTYGYSKYSLPLSEYLPFQANGRVWAAEPKRGDIAVFKLPKDNATDYIKRVIGLPGDTIELRGGVLIISGKPVKREVQPMTAIPVDANTPSPGSSLYAFVTTDAQGRKMLEAPVVRETLPGGATFDTIDMGGFQTDDYGPVEVPADHLFLMGDNRDGSADSRVPTFQKGLGGPVPFDAIAGRAEIITFSTDGTAVWYNPLSWFEALRPGRAGTDLRPARDAEAK